jgi:hypothetical protein
VKAKNRYSGSPYSPLGGTKDGSRGMERRNCFKTQKVAIKTSSWPHFLSKFTGLRSLAISALPPDASQWLHLYIVSVLIVITSPCIGCEVCACDTTGVLPLTFCYCGEQLSLFKLSSHLTVMCFSNT